MQNEIIILDERKATWTETKQVRVTRWEEQEVECSETYIDIRIPLKDLKLIAALGEGAPYSTVDMREAGRKLRNALRNCGFDSRRFTPYNEL